jgi:hypothetical protein
VVLLVVLMSWLNKRSLEQPEPETNTAAATQAPPPAAPAASTAPSAPAAAQGPVVLTATAPVWLQVSEKGGATLFSGTLQPNQTYEVPATASAPVLKTGKPEGLKITVGATVAPPVGPPATTVSNVSLLAADLLKSPTAVAPVADPVPAPQPRPRAPRPRQQAAPPAAPAPPLAETPTSNTGE